MSKTSVGELLSVKDKIINMWALASMMVSFPTTQLHHCIEKVATEDS